MNANESTFCHRVVDIICTLVRNVSPNSSCAATMAMGVNILAKMLKWYLIQFLLDFYIS